MSQGSNLADVAKKAARKSTAKSWLEDEEENEDAKSDVIDKFDTVIYKVKDTRQQKGETRIINRVTEPWLSL